MSLYFDTHAHLLLASDVQLAAIDYPILNVTTQPAEWPLANNLAQRFPFAKTAYGIHPWFAQNATDQDLDLLEDWIQRVPPCAIGEIGLDFRPVFHGTEKAQLSVFEHQLKLAQAYKLPISVHVLKAHQHLLSCLSDYSVRGVIHGLGAEVPLVARYLKLGFKIGINATLCRENARRYQQMVQSFGMEHWVLETDFPNVVLPSSQMAALSDLAEIALCLSRLTDLSVDEVLQHCRYNAEQVFG
ncbi:MAG: TatD family hydrolase [Thiotrichales bacterium]|nr:TatD family hydrolase [Thiotrichales bacterium]